MSARVCAQFELRALGDSAATQREQLHDGFCLGFLLQAWIQKNQLCSPVFGPLDVSAPLAQVSSQKLPLVGRASEIPNTIETSHNAMTSEI